MINIYAEGSKTLGLGHLSRTVPLYHYLKERGVTITVFLHGDNLGEAYLKSNQVAFNNCKEYKTVQKINNGNFWIVDSTKIWEPNFYSKIKITSFKNVLLSPKFDKYQLESINLAILRSDPFNIPVKNKNISRDNFFFNNGAYYQSNNRCCIGIALSGSNNGKLLSEAVNMIINNPILTQKISCLKIFTGGSGNFLYSKNNAHSYLIEVEIIDSLKSLWTYAENIDLMIVGNGIIVDECIINKQDFLIYDISQLGEPKSMDKEIASLNYTSDLLSLEKLLLEKVKISNKKSETKRTRKNIAFDEIMNIYNSQD